MAPAAARQSSSLSKVHEYVPEDDASSSVRSREIDPFEDDVTDLVLPFPRVTVIFLPLATVAAETLELYG